MEVIRGSHVGWKWSSLKWGLEMLFTRIGKVCHIGGCWSLSLEVVVIEIKRWRWLSKLVTRDGHRS